MTTTTETDGTDPILPDLVYVPDPSGYQETGEPNRAFRPWQDPRLIQVFLAGDRDHHVPAAFRAGTDFGTVPIRVQDKKDSSKFYYIDSKPVLFKPGAEKLCQWALLRPHFEPGPVQLLAMLHDHSQAVIRCELTTRWGEIVGEGLGAGALREPGKKWDSNPNSLVKVMKKRALVDAVLSLFALSERFTQDLEDFPKGLDADPGDESDPGWDDLAVNRDHPTEGKQRDPTPIRQPEPSRGAVRAATAATTSGSTLRGPRVAHPTVERPIPTTVKEAGELYTALCYEILGISVAAAEADPGKKAVVSDFVHKYRNKFYGPPKDKDGNTLRPALTLEQYIALITRLRTDLDNGIGPQV